MAKQLLVVDDDPSLLLAVSETLRAEGYEVVTARRGAEAMVRVAEALPDLILVTPLPLAGRSRKVDKAALRERARRHLALRAG